MKNVEADARRRGTRRYSQEYLLEIASSNAREIAEASTLVGDLTRAGLSRKEVLELATRAEKHITIPISIFRSRMGPLEALVKYSRDILRLPVHAISTFTGRSASTISISYRNATAPLVVDRELLDINFRKLRVDRSRLLVPTSAFAPGLSILEAVCVYLHRDIGIRYVDIARLIQRDQRTVFTVIARARRKT